MPNKLDSIINKFGNFMDGVRVLFLMSRNKDGGEKASVIKRVSMNKEEFMSILNDLLEIKSKSTTPLRIYSSVNSRDMEKTIRFFKHLQLDADYYSTEDRFCFYKDIKNRMISSLMSPKCKLEKNFLIDIDENEGQNYKKAISAVSRITRNIFSYKTKNGYHIILPPFDPRLLNGYEINKDGLLLLDY